MNYIVWVFGSSAAGKETFVRYVTHSYPKEILRTLNIAGTAIIPCTQSMAWVEQFDNDPNGPKREELLTVIPELLRDKENTTLFVKGQDLDLINNRLKKLKELMPTTEHRIVFLHTDVDVLIQRWHEKKWWDKAYNEETVKEWLRPQIAALNELKDEFHLTAFDSTVPRTYPVITFPPVL